MKKMPTLKAAMTPFPYSVQLQTPLNSVKKIMQEHNIHHLPVMDHGKIMGVITERDVKARKELIVNSSSNETLEVQHAYTSKPYIVDINEPFDNVLLNMADKRIGSAFVTKHGKLVGVFTYIDACHYFGEYLREKFPRGNDNDAA